MNHCWNWKNHYSSSKNHHSTNQKSHYPRRRRNRLKKMRNVVVSVDEPLALSVLSVFVPFPAQVALLTPPDANLDLLAVALLKVCVDMLMLANKLIKICSFI